MRSISPPFSSSAHPLAVAVLLAPLVACGLGDVGGGDDDDGSGVRPDAGQVQLFDAPPDPVVCATKYLATGDVEHDSGPAAGDACDGGGTWRLTASSPGPDEDGHPTCGDAPGEEAFELRVTVAARGDDGVPTSYTVVDQDDGGRSWNLDIADKSGSCSGSFDLDLADGRQWSIKGTENGFDGPLGGQGFFEQRSR